MENGWAPFESIVLYDDNASLRRDRKGNRFLYDAKIRSDATRIVQQDVEKYERIVNHSSHPTGRKTLFSACNEVVVWPAGIPP